jgi:hypothetical protein
VSPAVYLAEGSLLFERLERKLKEEVDSWKGNETCREGEEDERVCKNV